MSKKDDLKAQRTGRDFIGYAERHGGYVDRYSGGHAIIKGPKPGSVAVPTHGGELPPGVRYKISKAFVMLGIGALLLACLILPALR